MYKKLLCKPNIYKGNPEGKHFIHKQGASNNEDKNLEWECVLKQNMSGQTIGTI